jgi:hypothetical protein
VIAAVLRDSPTPLHVLYPQIMPELAHLTMRAMDRNPNLRYGSADEMLRALAELEAALGGEVSSPRIVPAARAMSSRPPARPLSFPSLELTREDLYPLRRRTSSFALPLLMLALGAAGAWAAWTEPGSAFVGYLKAQVQGQEPSASRAPTASAGAAPDVPAEALTAAAPRAALPEQVPENLFWDAPLRRLHEGEPRNMLLDTSAGALAAASEAGSEARQAQQASAEDANTAGQVDATPGDRAAQAERELRQRLRVRDEDESSDRYYQPVRSVPLQPVLDNIENALREAARDVAPPPQAEPLPRKADPDVPENPY